MCQVLTKANRVKQQGHNVPGCSGQHLHHLNSNDSKQNIRLTYIADLFIGDNK
jgi:hypothetical protein